MLHHVELYVSNLARALSFWEPLLDQLGYHESQRWPEGVSFMFGGTYPCFVQAPTEHLSVGYHRKRVGLNHLAWATSAGFSTLYDAEYLYAGGPGYCAFYCEDPDRIKVEVVAPSLD